MSFVESIWRAARAAVGRIGKGLAGGPNAGGHGANPWEEVGRELDRARRYGREFALVRIPAAGRRNGSRGSERDDNAASLASFVRTVDRSWTARGATYALLPETGRAGADALVARIAREAGHLLSREAVRVAVFPEDGLTSGALIGALEDRGSREQFVPDRLPDFGRAVRASARGRAAERGGLLTEDLERMFLGARRPELEPVGARVAGDGNGATSSRER